MLYAFMEWVNRKREKDFYYPEKLLGRLAFCIVSLCCVIFLVKFQRGDLEGSRFGHSLVPFLLYPGLMALLASVGFGKYIEWVDNSSYQPIWPSFIKTVTEKLGVPRPEPGPLFILPYMWVLSVGCAGASILVTVEFLSD